MRLHMDTYPISFWNVAYMEKVENTPAQRVNDWKDLGITLAMSPSFDSDYVQVAKQYLDECEKAGLKLILSDRRSHWRYLIENGVACNTFGSRQMSEYLGEKDSSLVYNFVVSGGTASENELRTGDYLELVEFSDFQVDPVGGDILGEIRLGYWHHDGKMSIITGGSVSGTMQDLIPSMRFTKETQQFDTAVVPAATKLFGVTITGVK